jgi:hypothetical protein
MEPSSNPGPVPEPELAPELEPELEPASYLTDFFKGFLYEVWMKATPQELAHINNDRSMESSLVDISAFEQQGWVQFSEENLGQWRSDLAPLFTTMQWELSQLERIDYSNLQSGYYLDEYGSRMPTRASFPFD